MLWNTTVSVIAYGSKFGNAASRCSNLSTSFAYFSCLWILHCLFLSPRLREWDRFSIQFHRASFYLGIFHTPNLYSSPSRCQTNRLQCSNGQLTEFVHTGCQTGHVCPNLSLLSLAGCYTNLISLSIGLRSLRLKDSYSVDGK